MITAHVKETMPGVAGNCTTVGAFSVAWFTEEVLPTLHALSLLVGIIAGCATAAYYYVMWRKARQE